MHIHAIVVNYNDETYRVQPNLFHKLCEIHIKVINAYAMYCKHFNRIMRFEILCPKQFLRKTS